MHDPHSFPFFVPCPCCGNAVPMPGHYPHYPQPEHCSICHHPVHQCTCPSATLIKFPKELYVDDSASLPTASTFISGEAPVNALVEMLPYGASPTLDLVIDGISVLSLTSIPAGFTVKKLPNPIDVGMLVELSVTDARARLRWCEDILC
jgi:hypothetical protein